MLWRFVVGLRDFLKRGRAMHAYKRAVSADETVRREPDAKTFSAERLDCARRDFEEDSKRVDRTDEAPRVRPASRAGSIDTALSKGSIGPVIVERRVPIHYLGDPTKAQRLTLLARVRGERGR